MKKSNAIARPGRSTTLDSGDCNSLGHLSEHTHASIETIGEPLRSHMLKEISSGCCCKELLDYFLYLCVYHQLYSPPTCRRSSALVPSESAPCSFDLTLQFAATLSSPLRPSSLLRQSLLRQGELRFTSNQNCPTPCAKTTNYQAHRSLEPERPSCTPRDMHPFPPPRPHSAESTWVSSSTWARR